MSCTLKHQIYFSLLFFSFISLSICILLLLTTGLKFTSLFTFRNFWSHSIINTWNGYTKFLIMHPMNWLHHLEFLRIGNVTSEINPFLAIFLFLYPLKTSKNQRFYDVSGGIERDQWQEIGRSGVFIVNFEHILQFVLVFQLLTLSR